MADRAKRVPSIVMCIPTRNRPEMVREVLEHELEDYRRSGIRLCYYDSSDDAETRETIAAFNARHGTHVGCKTLARELCVDSKLVEILKDFEASEEEYLWLVNDSISISSAMLSRVMVLAHEGYDLIRLPIAGAGAKEDAVSTDAQDWFRNHSRGMAHMASTVMRRTLVDAPHDWDVLTQKYIGSNELGAGHQYFFMVAFYLEQILQLQRFRGIYLGNTMKWRRDSPLKKWEVYWKDYLFDVWARSYTETILALPDAYRDKAAVIRASDNVMVGRFSRQSLVTYRLNGWYRLSTFFTYRKFFPLVSDEPLWLCLLIACVPVAFLRARYPYLLDVEDHWEEKMERLIRSLGEESVIIYGAGRYGENMVRKMLSAGRKSQLLGVAVTSTDGNIDAIAGVPVRAIDDYLDQRQRALVIVATLPHAAASIKKELEKRRFQHIRMLFQ